MPLHNDCLNGKSFIPSSPSADDLTHLTPWGKIGCRFYYFKHNIGLGFGHYSNTPGMGEREILSITARNQFIQSNYYALKAQDISAQGNALGR